MLIDQRVRAKTGALAMVSKTSRLMGTLLCAVLATALAATAAPKGSRWGEKYFPNHVVTSQDGKSYRFYKDLIENKSVVINFIYTNCPDICGLQSARMSIVQDKLGHRLGRDIFIYSISLDPKNDTPEALKAYSAAFGSKPGWLFLTGDPKQLHEIRYKLGERSRSLAEHRSDAVLGNDRTGEWGRSSMMANLNILTRNIIDMDPAERAKRRPIARSKRKTLSVSRVQTQRGQALYLTACSACHSIGMGKRVGPDLENVHIRREANWLINYITQPNTVRAAGDPIALALSKSFPGVKMPNLSLSKSDASDVIAYLKSETARLNGEGKKNTAHRHKGSHAGHAHTHGGKN